MRRFTGSRSTLGIRSRFNSITKDDTEQSLPRSIGARVKLGPVAVVNGEDPALFISGFEYLPEGQSEYDFAGAISGQPVEVHPGPETGLPIPVHTEIVLEGMLLPGETLPEGPFGEFTGYYASEARPSPVMEVSA